ncbi:MAG TPA: hypothetical protein VI072_36490 [Polyangiaceae bacterium]
MKPFLLLTTFTALGSTGCGGEVDTARTPECRPVTDEELTAYTGAYAITSYVEHYRSCANAPETPEDAPAFLSLKPRPDYMPGEPALFLGACFSEEVCSGPHSELGEYAHFFLYEFSCSLGDGSFLGKTVLVNDFEDGTCGWPRASDGSIRISRDGELELDIRDHEGADYTTPQGTPCSRAKAELLARTGKCFRRERARASKL